MKKLLYLFAACLMLISCDNEPTFTPKEMPKVYVTGYTLNKIPQQSRYYKLLITGTSWGEENFGRELIYSPLITNSSMPYTYMLQNKILLENISDYDEYTVYLYMSKKNDGTADDTQCLKGVISNKDNAIPNNKKSQYKFTHSNGTELIVYFEYK